MFGNLLIADGGKAGIGNYTYSFKQAGRDGQSGQIFNYNVTPLASRSYIPSGYTVLYPGSTAPGGAGAGYGDWYSGFNGEDGFCVISY